MRAERDAGSCLRTESREIATGRFAFCRVGSANIVEFAKQSRRRRFRKERPRRALPPSGNATPRSGIAASPAHPSRLILHPPSLVPQYSQYVELNFQCRLTQYSLLRRTINPTFLGNAKPNGYRLILSMSQNFLD